MDLNCMQTITNIIIKNVERQTRKVKLIYTYFKIYSILFRIIHTIYTIYTIFHFASGLANSISRGDRLCSIVVPTGVVARKPSSTL